MRLLLLACGSLALVGIDQAVAIQQDDAFRQKREHPGGGEDSRAYNPYLYEGFFWRSLWWVKEQNAPEPLCLATLISPDVAVTPCECVIERPYESPVSVQNHSAWEEYATQNPKIGGKVTAIDPSTIGLTAYFPRNPETPEHKVRQVTLHPKCGSFFIHNIALVIPTEGLPDPKVAWVITKEDALFSNAFNRVIAGQAISGRCTAPYYSVKAGFHIARPEKILPVTVEFQNWDACRRSVCPEWDRRVSLEDHNKWRVSGGLPVKVPYAKEICNNRVQFTKSCVKVIKPVNDSCVLPPGTPVYCESGDLNGFFGFLVNETFGGCIRTYGNEDLIFQGLHIAIDWLKGQLQDRVKADPTYAIPKWMSELKKQELSWEYEKDKGTEPPETPVPGKKQANLLYKVFTEDAAETVVNFYYDDVFECEGTQIAPSKFILPCWCVTRQYSTRDTATGEYVREMLRNDFSDPYKGAPEPLNDEAFQRRSPRVIKMNIGLMRVRRALDDTTAGKQCRDITESNPEFNPSPYITVNGATYTWPYCYGVSEVRVSETCDSHYLDDYAVITTVQPIPGAKTAWIQTSNPTYFKHALDVLSVSNMIGGDCFLVSFKYVSSINPDPEVQQVFSYSTVTRQYVRVNLAHWDMCRPLVCPPAKWFTKDVREKCINVKVQQDPLDRNHMWLDPIDRVSRMCITSYNYKIMCNVVANGSPVFCKSGVLRGMIGFISKFHMPACDRQRNPAAFKYVRERSIVSAVMMRLDRFFEMGIAEGALMRKIEESSSVRLRSRSGQRTPLIRGMATFSVLCFLVQ